MLTTLNIALIILLIFAFWQDHKSRSIHLFLLMAIAATAFAMTWFQNGDWQMIGMNIAFVLAVIGMLFIYVAFREGGITNIFKRHFGLGDVLFFMAISPLFSNRNFILFYISGMMLSGITHLLITRAKTTTTIPLAGYLSIYLITLKAVDILIKHDIFFSDII